MTLTQKKILRYVTIRLKWKTGFKFACSSNVTLLKIFFPGCVFMHLLPYYCILHEIVLKIIFMNHSM